MRPTFSGFEIAKTGIYISQAALNVTGHNIANAETPGYTRQRLDLAAIEPYGVLTRFAPMEQAIYGGGVESLKVVQIRNQFLDGQFRDQNTQLNYWSTKASSMSFVENMFDSTKDNELQVNMEAFFKSFTSLSKNPNDSGVRNNLISSANLLCDSLNNAYNRLHEQRIEANKSISANVDQINGFAKSIAALNEQIYKFEQTGHPANDLRDQRNYLMDQLSAITDITYSENGDGKLSVFVDGQTLVDHKNYNQMKVDTDATTGMHSVVWDDGSNTPVNFKYGEIKAHLDWRDGNAKDDYGLPYLMGELDKLANALADAVNNLHKQGYSHPNSSLGAVDNIDFFVQGTPAGAGNIKINPDIVDDEWLIAVSTSTTPDKDGNNDIALQLAELLTARLPGLNGSFSDYLEGMMSVLGSEIQYVNGNASTTFNLASSLESQRQSVSGVSLDEEMTNLIKFQHAYSAAARALTTMDEALDVLINRTGRVGL